MGIEHGRGLDKAREMCRFCSALAIKDQIHQGRIQHQVARRNFQWVLIVANWGRLGKRLKSNKANGGGKALSLHTSLQRKANSHLFKKGGSKIPNTMQLWEKRWTIISF